MLNIWYMYIEDCITLSRTVLMGTLFHEHRFLIVVFQFFVQKFVTMHVYICFLICCFESFATNPVGDEEKHDMTTISKTHEMHANMGSVSKITTTLVIYSLIKNLLNVL